MGWMLRRWLADRLPDGLSSGERLVALELADSAHDRTRLAYGSGLLDAVARRAGLADGKQVGAVLGKLARHGLELRVPIGEDKRGRPVYSHPGRATTYRIPDAAHPLLRGMVPSEQDHFDVDEPMDIDSDASSGPVDAGANGPADEANGPAPAAEWSRANPGMVPPPRDPTTNHHSLPLITALGATDAEAAALLDDIQATARPRNLAAFVAALARSGDLAALLAEHQAAAAEAGWRDAVRKARQKPPCVHGAPGGAELHPLSREPLCVACRVAQHRRAAG
jgi:hypothetical protein